MRNFRDFSPEERRNYITLSTGEYFPDILEDACRLYAPVLEMFSRLLHTSESSSALYINISQSPNQWMRQQLCRVFRKYVSPETPVEMLKRKLKLRRFVVTLVMAFALLMLYRKNLIRGHYPMRLFVQSYGNIKTEGKRDMI